MLSKEIMAWAKNFYVTSLRLLGENTLLENLPDSKILEVYNREFIEPVSKMLYGEVRKEIPQNDINAFLPIMRQCKVSNTVHYLRNLADDKFFTYTGSITTDLDAAAVKWKEFATEVYLLARTAKDPVVAYAKNNKLLGNFERNDLIILCEVKRFPKGLNLERLASQDPTKLTDFGIDVLRKVVSMGVLSANNLHSVSYVLPELDGTFRECRVTALTERLPSFFVRKLINELPEATIKDAETPYHAALSYAQAHSDEYRTALKELTEIVKNASIPSAAGLTDAVVAQYISDKYGISEKMLKEFLMNPTTEKYYTSAYFLQDKENMSAEDLLEKASNDPSSVSGTLDELLTAFCYEENFDVTDSVESLIRFINNDAVLPDKKPIQETLKGYIEASKISKDTTLEEFIEGIPHKYHDDAQEAIELIRDIPWVCDSAKEEMIAAIADEVPIIRKTLEEELQDLKVPADLIKEIVNAKSTGKECTPPELQDDAVMLHLVRKGIPRATAKEVLEGILPTIDVEAELRNKLKEFYPDSWVPAILAGKGTPVTEDKVKEYLTVNDNPLKDVLDTARSTKSSPDKGYDVAESLLFDMRSALTTKDSDNLRTDMLPVIYSYMRVLMMKKGDEPDVVEFLNAKKSECSDEIAVFIDNAVSKLEG